jgi:hypothetical protein
MVEMGRERGQLLQRVVERWGIDKVVMASVTLRHDPGLPLKRLRKAMSRAWKRLQQTWAWRRFVKESGLEVVRGLEATFGRNGWHPHYHCLLFFGRALSEEELDAVRELVFELWREAVIREPVLGKRCEPTREHGVDISPARSARYIAKLGLELTGAAFKKARGRRSISVAQIAAGAADGDEACKSLWIEWQLAMKGAKALCWTRREGSKLRELREKCELEIERERQGRLESEGWETVIGIPPEVFSAITTLKHKGASARGEILSCIRGGGDAQDVQDLIDDWLSWLREQRRE